MLHPLALLFVSTSNSYVDSNPYGDDIRRWGLWKVIRCDGGALMNGISALIKEILER